MFFIYSAVLRKSAYNIINNFCGWNFWSIDHSWSNLLMTYLQCISSCLARPSLADQSHLRNFPCCRLSCLFPERDKPLACGDFGIHDRRGSSVISLKKFASNATPEVFRALMNLIAGPMISSHSQLSTARIRLMFCIAVFFRGAQRNKLRGYGVAKHNLSYPKHPTQLQTWCINNENVFWILTSCKSCSGKFRCISTLGWMFIPLPTKVLAHVP